MGVVVLGSQIVEVITLNETELARTVVPGRNALAVVQVERLEKGASDCAEKGHHGSGGRRFHCVSEQSRNGFVKAFDGSTQGQQSYLRNHR